MRSFSILVGHSYGYRWALVNVECGEIKFWVTNEEVSFNICKSLKQPINFQVVSLIDMINGKVANAIEVSLVSEPLMGVLWNLGSEGIEEYNEVSSLIGLGSYTKTENPCKFDLDLNNQKALPSRPSIV